eukprot:Gb_15594 [translate_table: standard]
MLCMVSSKDTFGRFLTKEPNWNRLILKSLLMDSSCCCTCSCANNQSPPTTLSALLLNAPAKAQNVSMRDVTPTQELHLQHSVLSVMPPNTNNLRRSASSTNRQHPQLIVHTSILHPCTLQIFFSSAPAASFDVAFCKSSLSNTCKHSK